ncbi:RimJ/RimL family protein N-acetyltransferase [Salirhabdus euzebyi]|uniref:RimJ/RimL family protein N-acetyltransferase n=1 Tax=Salirhabdus euzebyi TaxID=394506 RepID=A0A841Q9N4_9BACI|nr:GNAT family N-acetyltransferase [Salirhabdus euzebyi]MBB6455085.1 RimJ/RimL family protein N-acetyltransferase [Salirhabdus euzebyi]
MLKKRELSESSTLFELLSHPEVFPYVRHKAASSDEYYFLTKQLIEAEDRGELISRTILDEWHHPIGTINLCDIHNNTGFLATWIGKPYFGQGYNNLAKEAFLYELFFELNIATVFMKIRKGNLRSRKAAEKLPYSVFANSLYPMEYALINKEQEMFDLYAISKDQFLFHYYQENQFAEKEA